MPKPVLIIHCSKFGKKAIDNMAYAGRKLPEEIRTFELPCAGRVNEVLLMETLENGMDGLVILGCRKDNCTNIDGNVKAEKRVNRIKSLLSKAGIKNKHLEMVFTAPDESKKLFEIIQMFYDKIYQKAKVENMP